MKPATLLNSYLNLCWAETGAGCVEATSVGGCSLALQCLAAPRAAALNEGSV